jgi:phosphate transport system permease protein
MSQNYSEKPKNNMPKREAFINGLRGRHTVARAWQTFYFFSNIFALGILVLLLLYIADGVFGYIAVEYKTQPSELSEKSLSDLTETELVTIVQEKVPAQLVKVLLRDTLSQVPNTDFTKKPMSEVLAGKVYDPAIADTLLNDLTQEQLAKILGDNLSQGELLTAIEELVLQPQIKENWRLFESIFNASAIQEQVKTELPNAELSFHSWLNGGFLTNKINENPFATGISQAIFGTLIVVGIAVLLAFPLGVGAAIYLEEYTSDNWINKFIETNIRNLAGVPSIIYGMLGLFIFVRVLEPLTSGAIFGVVGTNGRTLMSGGLTLGLVILPVIIINAREAIRAVPPSLREASFGLGGTKWQTVSQIVFPQAFPGILTGVILGISRAIGETAPLIVSMGAVTFISSDVTTAFQRAPVIPLIIYGWTSDSDPLVQSLAPAAILTLLIMLLLINSVAIVLRNRYTNRI